MRLVPVFAASALLSACAGRSAAPLVTTCETPRPQVCTMEYDPVCARLAAGGQKTYSSPCNACADDAVSGLRRGACPE